MKWKRGGTYWLQSDTGHRVSKAWARGAWRYSAWTPDKALIGIYDTAEEAKEACGEHKETQSGADLTNKVDPRAGGTVVRA